MTQLEQLAKWIETERPTLVQVNDGIAKQKLCNRDLRIANMAVTIVTQMEKGEESMCWPVLSTDATYAVEREPELLAFYLRGIEALVNSAPEVH